MAQSNTRKNVLHDHNYYSCTDRESSTSKLSIECDSKRKRSHSPKPSTSTTETVIGCCDSERKRSHSPKPSISTTETVIGCDSERKRSHSPKPSTSTTETVIGCCDSERKRSHSPKPSTSTTETVIGCDSERKRSHSPKPSTSTTETVIGCCDSERKRSHSPKPSTSTTEDVIESDTKRKRSHSPKPSTRTTEILTKSVPKSKRPHSSENTAVTPRKKKLMKKLKKSRIVIKNLQTKVDQIDNISSPVLKCLIESSIANQKRKPKGKRFTKLSKSVALAIYKKSPKAFKYLSTLLPMPSIRTLQTVLQNMKMEPGIDPTTLTHLKKKVERLSDADKLCVILFDEISLKKRLIYNPSTDNIDGYEDLGDEGGRTAKIADHALVLMLQGIRKKIKQPIAYYFVKGTIGWSNSRNH
ncbi:uncharacterized protein LOC135081658 isoform X2 [Ostrinia nubilalis]